MSPMCRGRLGRTVRVRRPRHILLLGTTAYFAALRRLRA
jgi:uracil-DNA glycosylase